jgi:hypothetical protein
MATKITDDGLSAVERTRRQELGSAWIMRRALKDNQRYSSWEDITKDKKYSELAGKKGIYPQVTVDWLKVYFLQQQKMLQEFSNPKFTEFNREYGFMDYITKLVQKEFGISKKDTWDPADIWCIKNESKVISDIEKLFKKKQFETISQLNAYLRTAFKERIIVGISLKKISGKQAKYEEVNVDGFEFEETKNPSFKVSYLRVDLSLKAGTSGDTSSPAVKNSDFWLETEEDGKKVTYKIDIGPTSGSKFTFVKFETKSTAATKARLGKAKAEYVRGLFQEYKIPIDSSALDYPKNTAEFLLKQDEYVKMFRKIKANKNIITNVKDEEEFLTNMKNFFMYSSGKSGKSVYANSKCQQVAVFAALAKLPKDKLADLGTKIAIASQKKGEEFGPFGKLY